MVAAAEQLSPNKPIELTCDISKVDYQLEIMARATSDKYRKEMRLEAGVWTGRLHWEGYPPIPTPL